MFERFTDRARRVVVIAQEESRSGGSSEINTGHILLGLVGAEGVAAVVLSELGFDPDGLREAMTVDGGQPAGHIPFTPRAKKVLELALREALQIGNNYIGTEHLLLGLIREGQGTGAEHLAAVKPLDEIRAAVIAKVKDYTPTMAETVVRRPPSKALCVCGHVEAHHAHSCEWRGCGCPRWITA